MPKCGSCKQEGQTVEHVQQCYADRYATLATDKPVLAAFVHHYSGAKDFIPMAFTDVPDVEFFTGGPDA